MFNNSCDISGYQTNYNFLKTPLIVAVSEHIDPQVLSLFHEQYLKRKLFEILREDSEPSQFFWQNFKGTQIAWSTPSYL